jgi:hypothetical protein
MTSTVFFRNLNCERPDSPLYLRFPHGVAYFSGNRWWYSGVNYGGSAQAAPIERQDISSLKEWVAATFGDTNPAESDYKPGTVYKRILWPLSTTGSLHNVIDTNASTQSFVALKLILVKMQDVFESVEPAQDNLQAYGHKIRELLLLASMEVEASWAAVLKANGYIKPRLSTNDYVKLLVPMLLDSHGLTLSSYPDFPSFQPFKDWHAAAPTQSLAWYDAYNQTKHNREEFLKAATLEKAIHAVGAATIMFYAQFGFRVSIGDERIPFIRNVFRSTVERTSYPRSCYIPNVSNEGASSWDWEILNFPFPS